MSRDANSPSTTAGALPRPSTTARTTRWAPTASSTKHLLKSPSSSSSALQPAKAAPSSRRTLSSSSAPQDARASTRPKRRGSRKRRGGLERRSQAAERSRWLTPVRPASKSTSSRLTSPVTSKQSTRARRFPVALVAGEPLSASKLDHVVTLLTLLLSHATLFSNKVFKWGAERLRHWNKDHDGFRPSKEVDDSLYKISSDGSLQEQPASAPSSPSPAPQKATAARSSPRRTRLRSSAGHLPVKQKVTTEAKVAMMRAAGKGGKTVCDLCSKKLAAC